METPKVTMPKGKKLTKLEEGLFNLLTETSSKECCWDVLSGFIDYIENYDKAVKAGSMIEEKLVAGVYEMTEKVETIDWDSMRKMIQTFKDSLN